MNFLSKLFGRKEKKKLSKKSKPKKPTKKEYIHWNWSKPKRRLVKTMHDKGIGFPEIFAELIRLYPNEEFAKVPYGKSVSSMLRHICLQRIDGSDYKTSEAERKSKRINLEEDSMPEEIERWKQKIQRQHKSTPPSNHDMDKICPACFGEESRLVVGKTLYQAWQKYLVIQKKKSTHFLRWKNRGGMKEEVQSLKSRFNSKGEYIPRKERKPEETEVKSKSNTEVKKVEIKYDETTHTWTEDEN